MKYLIFRLILRPLIIRDYRLRRQGKRRDCFHWADNLAFRWGFYVCSDY